MKPWGYVALVVTVLTIWFGTLWGWGNYVKKGEFDRGVASVVSQEPETLKVELPPVRIEVPVLKIVRDTVFKDRGQSKIADSVISVPEIMTLEEDGVKVEFTLQTTYIPPRSAFLYDISNARIMFERPVKLVTKLEYVPPPWWIRPAVALTALTAGYGIAKEDYALCAVGGGLMLVLVTIPL